MAKGRFKKFMSLAMVAMIGLSSAVGTSTTAFAASGEKASVYMVDYPRSGDTNSGGNWGHGNLNFMNGWISGNAKNTGLKAIGSYTGNIAYCIEPGVPLNQGDTHHFYNISWLETYSYESFCISINNLERLGLIEIPYGESYSEDENYNWVRGTQTYNVIKQQLLSLNMGTIGEDKGYIKKTSLAKAFYETCVVD